MKKIFISLIIIAGAVLLNACGKEEYKNITTRELAEMLANNEDDIQYVDIRTRGEYLESYIKKFDINIDYYEFEKDTSLLSELDTNKTVVIICRSGNRTEKAKSIFKNENFKMVYAVEGGIEKWKSEGREVI